MVLTGEGPRPYVSCRFTRTVMLPADADDEDVTAGCHNGILAVSIGLKNTEKEPHRKVPVMKGAPAPAAG